LDPFIFLLTSASKQTMDNRFAGKWECEDKFEDSLFDHQNEKRDPQRTLALNLPNPDLLKVYNLKYHGKVMLNALVM
jgi:hypothetical protein